jgi:hypothetical protein
VREGAFAAGAAWIIFHDFIESYEGRGVTVFRKK